MIAALLVLAAIVAVAFGASLGGGVLLIFAIAAVMAAVDQLPFWTRSGPYS